jgi:DNA recombination protein RmuC
MENLLALAAGVIIGSAVTFFVLRLSRKDADNSFSALSLQALRTNTEDFLKLANETLSKQTQAGVGELDTRKKLIDQMLESIRGDLRKVEQAVTHFDMNREKTFGEVSTQLKLTSEQTGRLQETTGKLQAALASSRVRGQWGERMAEDVLRFAGFIEGINYLKQESQGVTAARPDYTFLLPRGLKVNMDVKFPLDNYMKYLNEEVNKEDFKQQFLKDTRQRIKEVTTRDYINPANNTVDYVLVFVPSEQIYCFINENDNSIMDDAIKAKVILCSPLTLYAILAVIRQAVDNFNLEKTTSRILILFAEFNKQWQEFSTSLEKMGRRIDEAGKEYQRLISTRRNMLERPLREIDDLRKQSGIAEATISDAPVLPDAGADRDNAELPE